MRKIPFILLSLVLLFFLVSLPASAQSTWYVSPTGDDTTGDGSEGNPWRTISYAVSQASSGDTIKVMDDDDASTDDYVENITVNKSLTIERYDDDDTAPQVKAQSTSSHVFHVTANGVAIKGLDIYGATDSGYAGIYLDDVSGCRIESTRCGWDFAHRNYWGIYLYSSSNNTIINNTVKRNTSRGMELNSSSTDNFISGNTVTYNSAQGIAILGSSHRNTITGNTCSNNGRSGILINYSDYNIITNNTCSSNQDHGIFLDNDSDRNSLVKNTCNGNSDYGIRIEDSSSNNLIYLNTFSDNADGSVSSANSTNKWFSPTKLCYFYSSSHMNYLGNYYSDHNLADSDNDGITDADKDLPGNEPDDEYPLAKTVDNYDVQVWYLNNDQVMYEWDVGKHRKTVSIGAGASKVWVADEDAGADVTFPGTAGWEGELNFTSALADGHQFTIEIGYADVGGANFQNVGPSATITGDGSANSFAYTTDSKAFTVPEGKYLALRITNNSGSNYSLLTGGVCSYTTNPDTGAPNYPVPELSSLILLGAGLLVLLIVRRMRRSSEGRGLRYSGGG